MALSKPIKIVKFGGTSVADPVRLEKVARRLCALQADNHLIVVVSAMAGITNQLVAYCDHMAPGIRDEEVDVVLASGEQVTSGLLALKLKHLNLRSVSLQGWQVQMNTSSAPTQSRILDVNTDTLSDYLSQEIIPIVAGFQGINAYKRITTLGRGGSDTSAVAIAAAFKEKNPTLTVTCDIYTDVDGVYSADPRFVAQAKRLDTIPASIMLELAQSGSKVLHPRCVQIALKFGVPVRVLSSFNESLDQPGTLIIPTEENKMEESTLYGIAHSQNEYMITLQGAFETVQAMLRQLPKETLTCDLLTVQQNDLTASVTFMLLSRDLPLLNDLIASNLTMHVHKDKVKITLVGVGLQNDFSVLMKIYDCVHAAGGMIHLIHVSELKITLVTDQHVTSTLLEKLHSAFIS
ncbi:MAG: Aspartate kinase Ask_LysC [Holosporales bacterium]